MSSLTTLNEVEEAPDIDNKKEFLKLVERTLEVNTDLLMLSRRSEALMQETAVELPKDFPDEEIRQWRDSLGERQVQWKGKILEAFKDVIEYTTGNFKVLKMISNKLMVLEKQKKELGIPKSKLGKTFEKSSLPNKSVLEIKEKLVCFKTKAEKPRLGVVLKKRGKKGPFEIRTDDETGASVVVLLEEENVFFVDCSVSAREVPKGTVVYGRFQNEFLLREAIVMTPPSERQVKKGNDKRTYLLKFLNDTKGVRKVKDCFVFPAQQSNL